MKKITLTFVFLVVVMLMVGSVFANNGSAVSSSDQVLWNQLNNLIPQCFILEQAASVKEVESSGQALKAPAPVTPEESELNLDEKMMIDMVNTERINHGLNPLQVDMRLVSLARIKARDMIENNYFDHQSPTLGSPFDQMKGAGIEYAYAGENLAGASNVKEAHQGLMNSPGHRANILKDRYTHVGIGVVEGGPYGKMFVQHFIQVW